MNESGSRNAADTKKRYIGMDVFRIIAVISVCAFHTVIHLNADYGPLRELFQMGAVFMTAFFMLSGYLLFMNYSSADLMKKKALKTFYIKRGTALLPIYYAASLIFIILHNEDFFSTLIISPIEILGIQTVFASLYPVTHNGGTWFISCLLICYVLYPFVQELVKQASLKTKIICIALFSFILLYSPIVEWRFETQWLYANPFFRMLEFSIGVILASLKSDIDNLSFSSLIYRWRNFFAAYIIFILGITLAVRLKISVGNYMLYSWIGLPCFIVMILCGGGVRQKVLEASRLLRYLCELSYTFFLAQLYSNYISGKIIEKYGITSNLIIILTAWSVCIVIAVALHELLEKPISKLLKKAAVKGN